MRLKNTQQHTKRNREKQRGRESCLLVFSVLIFVCFVVVLQKGGLVEVGINWETRRRGGRGRGCRVGGGARVYIDAVV